MACMIDNGSNIIYAMSPSSLSVTSVTAATSYSVNTALHKISEEDYALLLAAKQERKLREEYEEVKNKWREYQAVCCLYKDY